MDANPQVYMETEDNDQGILLACDICRDQGRDRIVKQLGWTVSFEHALSEAERHLLEHPVVSKDNDPQ